MRITRPKDIGSLVRDYRRKKSLKQAELAKTLRVSPKWLSQFENGKATAQIGIVIRVLNELGLSLYTHPPGLARNAVSDASDRTTRRRFSIDDVVDD
jgi:transcriptional regulator with XRE-family HTH domain